VPFGVNEVRLTARQWLAAVAIVMVCAAGLPRLWKHVERFDTPADYRLPYAFNEDYWLFQRRLESISDPVGVPVLGDSVIWGEYVRPDGTLTHFLNQETGRADGFVNCGVNGLFPLAMEGLIGCYASALHNRRVIVHCNVLWMTSPKADLSTRKEEPFNHTRLVPQFSPRIPCYRADTSARVGAVVARRVGLFAWVSHLESVYFDQRSIPGWTLIADDSDPPRYPNAWRNPLRQVTLAVPGEPAEDPQRGPDSARHRPWTESGGLPRRFDWVSPDDSLQWQAFQRVLQVLRWRGNDVLVILGPFNEHMVAPDQRPVFGELRDRISDWLTVQRVAHVIPETLPSDLYGDASHPLTEGYALLGRRICQDAAFQAWLAR
jgi:hypothetical protein